MKKRKYKRAKSAPVHLEKKTIVTVLGIALIAFSLLLTVSLFTKTGALQSLKDYFYNLFGIGVIFVPLVVILISFPLLSIKIKFSKPNVIAGSVGAALSFLGLVAAFSDNLSGVLGASLWQVSKSLLTPVGAFVVLFFAFLATSVIAANTSLEQVAKVVAWIFKKLSSIIGALKRLIFRAAKPKFITKSGQTTERIHLPRNLDSPVNQKQEGLTQSVVVNSPGQNKIWQYPPLSLLAESRGAQANRGNLKQNAHTIEKTLESFGITAKVVEVNLGPTITQYALEIPMGTKLSKILALQNDLALALATSTGNVRVEAPIPGKSLVGIEIPNISPEMVSLKNILSNGNMRANKSKLAVGLGLDVSGNPVITDVARLPHVLVAGTTGSGKSVLINALIATLLFRASPQEVKLILVDPKRVELTEYNDIPHLLTPVIVEPEKILSALKWATTEMDRRYKMFHDAQVRNIASFNELSGFQALPYIVIVIDELQNLMEFAPVEVEDTIVRLAAMARATGIHLVLATQRPSVDVITGLIKANIPCRIAFNVSSMVDSRVIIDQPGAEKLLGKGDMLYVPPDASKPMRIQGVYVSDTEIRNLIGFLKSSGITPEYTEEVIHMPIGKMKGTPGTSGDQDDLFEEAVRTICQYDRASASLLQRRLRIGYARAARLLDELEMAGIVGPGDGSKPRDVLVKNPDDYFQAQAQSQSEANL
ncbi:MAG: Cell division protein FtsK/SpoIIIE [Candidatus Curtissbacteria bacterium GW2011_GWA1_40_16]|uniref:Cell division protein FtsK/SpoIIIE n=1 Tax=Candidatus Curtissbacteria bacterium GW2011_GWA1_40_16 TaxID=1618405 RepID=A0A0G0UJR5_9BACT|nr:MAG: Cell division protein FtsK/SpoIIIE [Candidatus Curtissbacteria bacterium GW2011_GWA1_40_16]